MGLNTVMASSEYDFSLGAHIAIDGGWGDPYSYWGTPTGVTNARYYTRSENTVSVKALQTSRMVERHTNAWLPVNVSIEYFDGTDWVVLQVTRCLDQRLADVSQQYSCTGRVLAPQYDIYDRYAILETELWTDD